MMMAQEHEVMMTKAQKDSENPEVEDLELVETPPMGGFSSQLFLRGLPS